MVQKVFAAYFSPAGSTEAVTKYIADRMAKALKVPVEYIDFTLPGGRQGQYSFEEEDLVSTEVARLANLCILEAAG